MPERSIVKRNYIFKRPNFASNGPYRKKGEGKFRRATWEEALEKAAEGFLKIKNNTEPGHSHHMSEPAEEKTGPCVQ